MGGKEEVHIVLVFGGETEKAKEFEFSCLGRIASGFGFEKRSICEREKHTRAAQYGKAMAVLRCTIMSVCLGAPVLGGVHGVLVEHLYVYIFSQLSIK